LIGRFSAALIPFLKKFTLISWQFFTGVIITIIAFATNFVDLKQPELTVEITAVNTSSSEPIDLLRFRELSAVQDVMEGPARFIGRNQSFSPDDIDRQLLISTNRLSGEVGEIDRYERQLDALISNAPKDQDSQLNDLERALAGPFEAIETSPNNAGKTNESDQARRDALIAKIRTKIADQRKSNAAQTAKLEEAQKQWTTYKESVLPNKARLLVTCAVGNRGAGATSLKPQALLRANLGEGNYLDLPMRLRDYESSADLAALQSRSYKVMRFQSEEVESMTEADRLRFKTFLGNVSPATIFVADVRGRTYPSNAVPFSPGVYEQKVYDSLKGFASKSVGR